MDEVKQFEALTNGVGRIDLDNWEVLKLTGDDRAKFLHGFCTAEIVGLEEGQVTEAFVLDSKGKTIGYFHVANFKDHLLMVGNGKQAEEVAQHLDRYLIREKVQIENKSSSFRFALFAGPMAHQLLIEFDGSIDSTNLEPKRCTRLVDGQIAICSEFAGSAILCLISNENESAEVLPQASKCSRQVLEAYRLQHRSPWFGIEVLPSNLPQEIDRDEQSISFEKGCYLGQETVARIDSLGRVNKLLRFATCEQGSAAKGDELMMQNDSGDKKQVGQVLAFAKVPGTDRGLASLMVKRVAAESGQALETESSCVFRVEG